MSKIENFSEVIASKVAIKLTKDHDQEEVLAYGAFVLIQTLICIIMDVVFGIVFNVLIETLIISFTASILRKSSGGAHATSAMNCAIIGMVIFGALALLVKHYVINIGFLYVAVVVIASCLFAYYIMYKYSPVGTVTKPLKNENTRNRLKKLSIKMVLSSFVINVLLMIMYLKTEQIQLLNIAICISAGVAWQSITMVSLGHKVIYVFDKILGGTNSLIRRTK